MGKIHQENFIDLTQDRMLHFPFQLQQTGSVVTADYLDYDIADHGHLEFCLRLSSPEQYAYDQLDERRFRSTFPHLFIKKPNMRHRYTIRGERQAVFMIYPAEMLSRFEAAGMNLDLGGLEFELTSELAELIDFYRALFPVSRQLGIAERFDLTAFQILEIIYLQALHKHPQRNEIEYRMQEIASEMHLNFHRRDLLDYAIRKFGYSKRTFLRYWDQYFDLPPAQYIENLRMQEAGRLLRNRSWQIQEISAHLGYSSVSYFIQAFKRYYGKSPKAMQKK